MVTIINGLIKIISSGLTWVIILLPNSPFQAFSTSSISEHLSALSWLVPVSSMITLGTAWLSAIGVYYIYKVALRWIKAIE